MAEYVFETGKECREANIDFQAGDTIQILKPDEFFPTTEYVVVEKPKPEPTADFTLPEGNLCVNPKYKGNK